MHYTQLGDPADPPSRELSLQEAYFDLLPRHKDLETKVRAHEAYIATYPWDQLYATAIEATRAAAPWWDVSYQLTSWLFDHPAPIPPRGVVVDDSTYGSVIVHPDAMGNLRFRTTRNSSLVSAIQKPVYVSDPNYLDLMQSIAEKVGQGGQGLLDNLPLILGLVAAIVIVPGLMSRR